ncbi:uncharacterized protein Z519_04057 [Cladophialophora bantiana CBS 173.52]|uniref:Uncharacterized protein n=1 Tax=Cladophialophora bantiana (strain ATCC 10958 / CBS 173.52 / CDC B-1940 / NIH 8579) TaxID=1442370 RepID=A0A0D2GA78_CLAB1|nr:uncharacterized protein Z519_04057 [Cladophialophora bantiana CBS 173.52]KIW95472.1 hypothetical protein Z519_04057 [Cladophialophora bantiana CBS 173.52]
MYTTNDTPRKAAEATALAKALMRVARCNAAFIANRTSHGIKRSHQIAFGSEQSEYGRLCKDDDDQKPKNASLCVRLRPCLKPDPALRTALAKKAVSFNNQVRQVLFSQDGIIGGEEAFMTTHLSGIPSLNWRISWLEKTIQLREMCLRKARDGCMPACSMHLRHSDYSKNIPTTWEEDTSDSEGETSSVTELLANMTLVSGVDPGREVEVHHLLVGNLYYQAVREIEGVVQQRLSTLTSDPVCNDIRFLSERAKWKLTELLQHLGVIYPYHCQAGVVDARLDRDWAEVDAKAEALFVSCASPWVVAQLSEILQRFKRKLDREIRSIGH